MSIADIRRDYMGEPLSEGHADADPWAQFARWFEQVRGADGAITFKEHVITSTKAEEKVGGVQFSQLHAVTLAGGKPWHFWQSATVRGLALLVPER